MLKSFTIVAGVHAGAFLLNLYYYRQIFWYPGGIGIDLLWLGWFISFALCLPLFALATTVLIEDRASRLRGRSNLGFKMLYGALLFGMFMLGNFSLMLLPLTLILCLFRHEGWLLICVLALSSAAFWLMGRSYLRMPKIELLPGVAVSGWLLSSSCLLHGRFLANSKMLNLLNTLLEQIPMP